MIGLGVDESYMVASGRSLQLSYFDHPPIAWWMAWVGAHFFGTDSALAVRSPFIVAFAASTWLMYRLTTCLFNARAGLWAALLLNGAPLFGVTTGSWVLPDGPLVVASLGAVLCLTHVFQSSAPPDSDSTPFKSFKIQTPTVEWGWWLGAGVCAGLALLSKYTAALSIIGIIIFLITTSAGRSWLRRPHPYVSGLTASLVFSPALFWNAAHGWISILFQGGRANIGKWHPFGPLSTFGGEALFLLPWIWLPLIVAGIIAVWRGPRDIASWMLVCMAAPPIVFFAVISIWSHVLFHWAIPGYTLTL